MARPKKEETKAIMSEEKVLDSLQGEIDQARIELEKTKRMIEEKKAEIASSGRREIDANEMRIIEKQIATSNQKEAKSKVIEEQKRKDNEKVTGKFINRRAPGQSVKLPYMKYEDDPVKWHPFEDGKVYTIPRGFAEQINEYYHTPVFTKKEGPMDPNAPSSQIHAVDTSNKKYAFVPVNF